MSRFAHTLQDWHAKHGRHNLPWQNTRDPYRIWLSEIMLQQTQVDAVIRYYARFLDRFPDLATLAAAPTEEVLGLWSGLGYYARARNLHQAAQMIMSDHGGRFPVSVEAIESLPGIGRSTAAAIAAFAFGQRAAILDGNVKRVLCRYFGVDGWPGEPKVERSLWTLAESLLPETGIETYTQAQMDFGATLCTRARPRCTSCPLAQCCIALRDNRTGELPAPKPRKAVPQRAVAVAVICSGNQVLLEQRPPSGIWGGLLGLPEIPDGNEDAGAWLKCRFGLVAQDVKPLPSLRHAFTHFRLDMFPLHIETDTPPTMTNEPALRWLALEQLADAALPTPVRRILENLETGQQILPLQP